MSTARLRWTFVLLLYLKISLGQQVFNNNQNNGVGNGKGLQQQNIQRTSNNINQIPNGGFNINLAQQSNSPTTNLQQTPNLSASKQGNSQQSLSLPPNLQSQSASGPQNNLQITKIGFTPVSSATVNNPYDAMQLQNGGVNPNVQMFPSNNPASQITNTPISTTTLADILGLKGQSSLISFLNSQNGGQNPQNQQIVMNTIPAQNQLTDAQKQYLVRSLQSQGSGQNQQGVNVVQAQARVANVDNQQAMIRGLQNMPQQAQAIVTPLGSQPAYITVQAQPLTNYLQNQPAPQVVVEEEPSLISVILSELGPQYGLTTSLPPTKGSKSSLKALIPLIINLLKEKNSCKNCACQTKCQSNCCQSTLATPWPSNMMTIPEPQQLNPMAEILGGYSNQMIYGPVQEDAAARIKKNDDEELRKHDKERKVSNKKPVVEESEEDSEEDDSEYIDDDEE